MISKGRRRRRRRKKTRLRKRKLNTYDGHPATGFLSLSSEDHGCDSLHLCRFQYSKTSS